MRYLVLLPTTCLDRHGIDYVPDLFRRSPR